LSSTKPSANIGYYSVNIELGQQLRCHGFRSEETFRASASLLLDRGVRPRSLFAMGYAF
jgi:hypothetical protein